MKKELAVKQIYDDFISKVTLTDCEKEILDLYIKDESIVKIANTMSLSTSSVSREIADIKEKYAKYKQLELARLLLLK